MTEQYNPTEWQNGVTELNATNMNKIETGVTNNSTDIITLKSDMKFKGVISALPESGVEVGNVYQAAVANMFDLNKIGDLLICTAVNPIAWHRVPSGDETSGTVTSISAGTGLSGGTITGSGALTIDSTYTANATRNGLMSKEDYEFLHDSIDRQWVISKNYTELSNIPLQIKNLTVEQSTGSSANAVMSQGATTAALGGKSNVGHHHAIRDVDGLGTELSGFATSDHRHGCILVDGRLDDGSSTVANSYMKSDITGLLQPIAKIPSGDINGTSINGIDISTLRTESNTYTQVLEDCVEVDERDKLVMKSKAAKELHSHPIFTNPAMNAGFVPKPPTNNPGAFLLAGNGSWVSSGSTASSDTIINIIYPVGSYLETSDPVFDPGKTQYYTPAGQLTNEAGGDNTLAHNKWPGIWVLENEGLFHVSGKATGAYPVSGIGSNLGAYADSGKGAKNGGAESVLLTGEQSGQKGGTYYTAYDGAHTHSMGEMWSNGSGNKSAYKKSDGRSLKTYNTGGVSTTHRHSFSIAPSNATRTHENRPPYVCIYRWHRTALVDPADSQEATNTETT